VYNDSSSGSSHLGHVDVVSSLEMCLFRLREESKEKRRTAYSLLSEIGFFSFPFTVDYGSVIGAVECT
jgi:hypothetical protein